ncbi:MAG: hypothetical protein ACI4TP_05620 [Anaerotignum sp.]
MEPDTKKLTLFQMEIRKYAPQANKKFLPRFFQKASGVWGNAP